MRSDRTVDSYNALFITLEVRRATDTEWTRVPAEEFVQGVEIDIPVDGVWTGTLTLVDGHADYIERLSAHLGNLAQVRVSFARTENRATAPVFTGIITDGNPQVTLQAYSIVYSVLADVKGAYRNASDVVNKEAIALPTHPIEALMLILRRMKFGGAEKASAWSEVKNLVVDPDVDMLERAIPWRAGQSAISILQELAHYTRSSKRQDQAPYHFSISPDGTAYFVRYRSSLDRSDLVVGGTRHSYVFGRDAMGEVIDAHLDDNSLWAAYSGADGSPSVINGTTITEAAQNAVKSTTTTTPGGDSTLADRAAPYLPTTVDNAANRFVVPGMFNQKFMRQDIGNWLDYVRTNVLKLTLVVRGTHDVKPFDFIDLQYRPTVYVSRPHMLTNNYRVMHVHHTMQSGEWVTTLRCYAESLNAPSPFEKKPVKAAASVAPGKPAASPQPLANKTSTISDMPSDIWSGLGRMMNDLGSPPGSRK